MVLQALQLQTPMVTAPIMRAQISTRLNDFDRCFLIVLLVFEYYGTKFLLNVSAYKDAAAGVFRFGTAMYSDTFSAGDVFEYRQQSLKAGAHRDVNGVMTTWDEVFLVFERDADVLKTVVRTYIQISEDAFPVRRFTVEPITMIDFIVHGFCFYSGNLSR